MLKVSKFADGMCTSHNCWLQADIRGLSLLIGHLHQCFGTLEVRHHSFLEKVTSSSFHLSFPPPPPPRCACIGTQWVFFCKQYFWSRGSKSYAELCCICILLYYPKFCKRHCGSWWLVPGELCCICIILNFARDTVRADTWWISRALELWRLGRLSWQCF